VTPEPGTVRFGDLAAGGVRRRRRPDAGVCSALARSVGVVSLTGLEADFEVRPWLDGCEVKGRFRCEVTQICGVSLEPFSQPLEGDIDLRLLPQGSPNLPAAEEGELEVSLETPDPPETQDGDLIDLDAILAEHLALAVDPFPRRPDAVFSWSQEAGDVSPFAALRNLTKPTQT
jgi:hypothetical protein